MLILVENLPVPFDRRVWQEGLALRDAGWDVTVVCPQMRGYTAPEEELAGIHVLRHRISGEAGGFWGFLAEYGSALWGELRCAWRAWRRAPFDVIHLCNPPDLLFLVALPWKLTRRVRVVYDVHDLWPEMYEAKFGRRGAFYWLVRLAERATLALADVVIATNESVRDTALRRGRKDPADVFVVRTSPVGLDLAAPEDPALRSGRRFLVGYVGVMGDADGVDLLLRAAHHVVRGRGREDVQFLLMGSGPELPRLLALRRELGLDAFVTMPGRVSDEALCRGLRTIDVGVACDPANPYNDHCTMNKVLEYMAFGKPQVMFATREGRRSAGDAARYVDENSPERLGDAVLELLGDEGARRRMGREGERRLREELGWERSVEALRRAYAAALGRRGG